MKTKNINKNFLINILLGSFFLLIFILNTNTIRTTDDYAFYNNVWNNNQNFSFIHIFDRSAFFYLNWTGRFVSTFANYVFLYFPKYLFNIVNSLFFVTFNYLIYKIIKKNNEEKPIMLLRLKNG